MIWQRARCSPTLKKLSPNQICDQGKATVSEGCAFALGTPIRGSSDNGAAPDEEGAGVPKEGNALPRSASFWAAETVEVIRAGKVLGVEESAGGLALGAGVERTVSGVD